MRRAGGGRGRERQSGERGGPERGSLRHGKSALTEATGTNGLNFIFCNTLAVFHDRCSGAHAPAIYFIAVFLWLMPEISLLGIVIRISVLISSPFSLLFVLEKIWNLANDNRKEIYFYFFFQDRNYERVVNCRS